jgi:L-serine dehydratase
LPLFFSLTDSIRYIYQAGKNGSKKGVITELSGILYQKGLNIARMANERSKINGPAITICEIDNQIGEDLLTILKSEIPIIDEILIIQTK